MWKNWDRPNYNKLQRDFLIKRNVFNSFLVSIKFLDINIKFKVQPALLSLELTLNFDYGMHLMVFLETASRPLWVSELPLWGMLPLDSLITTVDSALYQCNTLRTGYSFVTL
jgi:hypothetical protein